jgi:lipopolysaccharide transport system ATP-binding protein
LHQIFSWDYRNPLILEKTFEDLVANPVEEFRTIFSHLRMVPRMVSEADLARAVEGASFSKLSGGRTPGQEDASHHYRKGEAGDWKNHFSQRHKDLFKKLYDPILLKTGYEKSADW